MSAPTVVPSVDELRARPVVSAAAAARFLGVSERAFRAATAPGSELEHLVIRIGRRVVVKTAPLLALVDAGDSS